MPFLTKAEAVRAAQTGLREGQFVEAELRKSARTAVDTAFDIFLSHSYEDARIIFGVKRLLERRGLSVYVDWVEDRQLDRSQVTKDTARRLRTRMNHCGYLLYASSRASSSSKWMPWELGYFDGRRPERVGILPITESADDAFVCVEYLGLYPLIQYTALGRRLREFAWITGPGQRGTYYAADLKGLARS
jgi:hypothetical protein